MDSSVIIVICICATALAVVAILVFGHRSKSQSGSIEDLDDGKVPRGRQGAPLAVSGQQNLQIAFERVESLTPTEEERMVEITDQALVAQIDSAIPVAIQVAANADAASKAENVINSVGEVVKADVPLSMLDKSREVTGAMRGSVHAGGKYVKNANLTPFDMQQVGKDVNSSLVTAGTINAAMGIASIVVGQYNMTQINNRLNSVEKGIDRISDFQDSGYKGRVMKLIEQVKECATFQVETLQSDELRIRELHRLDRLKSDCQDLLGQANDMLQRYAAKKDITFEEYERLVGEADAWYDYQQILLRTLAEIAKLDYTLSLGAKSRENCYASFEAYASHSEQACKSLHDWHGHNMTVHGIDEHVSKRRRKGIAAGVIGLVNDEFHYRKIHPLTRMRIMSQRRESPAIELVAGPDLYKQDVQLIKKDGKTYYLPPSDDGK